MFIRWLSWSTRHRLIAGAAGLAGGVGIIGLIVWMLWRYPGGPTPPGDPLNEGSPPQWFAIVAAALVLVGVGVGAYGVARDWMIERRPAAPNDAQPTE